jgi:hypothetical protein
METIHFTPKALSADGLGRKYVGDDGFVYRPAEFFRVGKYEDKGFELTHEEADEAIRSFSPVKNNIEHRASLFDGLIGEAIEPYRQGDAINGKLRIPKWLDDTLGEEPIRLSAEWSKEPKRLVGMAMVLNPRVATAAAHAFTATPDFHTFAAEHPSEAAELVTEAAKAPLPAKTMPLTKDQLWADFTAKPENAGAKREEFDALFANAPEKGKEKTEQDLRIEKLERDLAFSQRRDNDRDDAEAAKKFYADLLEADGGAKTCPAEREIVEAAFTAARAADRAKTANFTANADGSHEKQLREKFASRKAVFSVGGGRLASAETIDLTTKGASPLGGLEAHFAAQDAAKKENK